MLEIPELIIAARDEFCRRQEMEIAPNGEFWWGLDAYLWQSSHDTIVKVHRYGERFEAELRAYQRFSQRNMVRLRGFRFPQLLDCAPELSGAPL